MSHATSRGSWTPLVPPAAGASPPRRPDGIQLHILDGAGVAHRDRPNRLPVPVVVVTMSTAATTRGPGIRGARQLRTPR